MLTTAQAEALKKRIIKQDPAVTVPWNELLTSQTNRTVERNIFGTIN